MSEMKTLDEICDIITDGSHFSPSHFPDGIPIYSVKDMGEFDFVNKNTKTISFKDYISLKNSGCEPREDDILIAKDGSVMKHVFKYKKKLDCVILSSIAILRPNKKIVDPDYLVYSIKNPSVLNNIINNYVSGSGVPRIILKDFKKVKIKIPSINIQKSVSKILNNINDKIKVNIEINKTLEATAKALFKSWFIDFDPIKEKEVRKSLNLSKEIKDLFPDSLEISNLYEIPKGWEIKKLSSILSFLGSGNRPKGGASNSDNQIPSIGAENINFLGNYNYKKEKYIPFKFFQNLKKKNMNIQDYDILIYKDGANIGRSTIFGKGFPHHTCTINEHVFILRSEEILQKYLYFYLSTTRSQNKLISLNTGSAQPGINQKSLNNLEILLPSKPLLIIFNKIISKMIDTIFLNCIMNKNLFELRDTLLPRLIKGQLRISDIKKNSEERDI